MRAPFSIDGRGEGAASPDGRVVGSYLHGVFTSDPVRAAFLESIAGVGISGTLSYDESVEATLDKLAAHLERHLDVEAILALARQRPLPG
jgi:adenosylcobyric acid synthase